MAERIGKLCRNLLPADFEQHRRQMPAIQQFLDSELPDPLAGAVTLLTASDREIVIAAASPPLANYLRLYTREIEAQLNEAFGMQRRLKVRTLPASATRLAPTAAPLKPRPVGAPAVDAVERNARWIEDESLRESLLSLARAMRNDAD